MLLIGSALIHKRFQAPSLCRDLGKDETWSKTDAYGLARERNQSITVTISEMNMVVPRGGASNSKSVVLHAVPTVLSAEASWPSLQGQTQELS